MDKNFNLDELLDYGEEYYYPELIDSDYFIPDKRRKNNMQRQMANQQNSSNSNGNNSNNSSNSGRNANQASGKNNNKE